MSQQALDAQHREIIARNQQQRLDVARQAQELAERNNAARAARAAQAASSTTT
jgi:hypothetical protein